MPLETGRITLVPNPEIAFCEFCGSTPMPGRMEFVAFDANTEDVPPGTIETVDNQGGQVAYRVRDPSGHGTVTLTVRVPQVCCDCLKQAAGQIGYGDRAPLLAELDELRQEHDELRAERDRLEQEKTEAELALRDTTVYERLLAAGLPVSKAATATAKRPAARKA